METQHQQQRANARVEVGEVRQQRRPATDNSESCWEQVIRVLSTDSGVNMKETSEVSAAASGLPVSATARELQARAESPRR